MTALVRRAPAPPPAAGVIGSLLRSRRMVQRNLLVYKHCIKYLFKEREA